MTTENNDAPRAAAQPCVNGYGPHPEAHPAIAAFAEKVDAILDSRSESQICDRVAEALRPVLDVEGLLCDALRSGSDRSYRKHVLYACPDKRFTLLALVWKPGQGTVIHGHTAWGAVGVYEGTPNVAVYDCLVREDGRHEVRQIKDIRVGPGELATVRRGLDDVHRIYNDTKETLITLHAYGRDLVEDPDAINLHLSL